MWGWWRGCRGERKETILVAQVVLSPLCLQPSDRLGTARGVSLLHLVPVNGDDLVLREEVGPDGAERCPSPPCFAFAAHPADSQVCPLGAWGAAAAPAGTSQLKTHVVGSDSLKATQ